MTKIATSVFILLMILCDHSLAQTDYEFHHLTVTDGLSHNNVYEIYRDSYGYIWIGTGTGLHRYSGVDFKTFRHHLADSTSIGPGYVRSIFEDQEGAIWVGLEGGGLSRYFDGKFSSFRASNTPGELNNDFVEHMIEMPDGSLYIATWGGGINVYKNGSFSQIMHDPKDPNSLQGNDIVDLLYDDETGILWIGTWGEGLCALKDGKFTVYKNDENGFNSDKARTLSKTTDGSIWIGSWGNGLYRYKNGVFTNYDFSKEQIRTAEENKILSLSADPNGDLWIGTFGGGLKLYNGHEFKVFINNPDDRNSIASNFIESSFLDSEGSLWIGAYGGGITKIKRTHFHRYKHTNLPGALSDNYVRNILELENGNLLICTRGKGVDLFDGETFTPIDQMYGESFSSLPIFTVTQLDNGDIWMGGVTGVGLWIFRNNHIVEVSERFNIDFKEFNINSILESSDGSIWIGGDFNTGVIQIEGNKVTRYFHDPNDHNSPSGNNIWCIYESSDSTIWIGTRRFGLDSYKNGIWNHFASDPYNEETISNNFVFDIHESEDGALWLATENGFNKFQPKSGKFKRYFENDGLINDYVTAIEQDNSGLLWLSTHGGLVKFDPRSEQMWNYDIRDGIDVYPFNTNASSIGSKTGNIYFGGVGGFVSFHPDSIGNQQLTPTIQITDFFVSDQSVEIEPGNILTRRIEETKHIELSHDKRKISFEFSPMSFDFSTKYKYAYQLKGLNDDWRETKDNSVSFNNLDPGEYTFSVRSSFDNVYWSAPKQIDITVMPHFHETIWFKIIVVAFLLLGLLAIHHRRNRYLHQQRALLANQVKEKTLEIESRNIEIIQQNEDIIKSTVELQKAYKSIDERNHELEVALEDLKSAQKQLVQSEKMASLGTLAAGIGHEINNPLNFLQGGVESLRLLSQEATSISSFKQEAGPLLDIMQEGIDRTAKIVKSLSHFSRNVDRWDETCDVASIIDNCLVMLGGELDETIRIIKDYEQVLPIKGNSGNLHQAFLNILINATQAIKEEGTITIAISQENNYLKIVIADTGLGISEENLAKISDPFFTTKSPGKGTGMGLAITYDIITRHDGCITCQSQKNVGTSFIIELPLV
jgi:signal transduction histidine kinase/ligand-binding sensor domain-containing protein